jgi:propanediol dehydratase large subunit
MEIEEVSNRFEITEKGQGRFKLAKAIEKVTFRGVAGKLIEFEKLGQDDLIQLSNIVNKELRWRAIPNTDKGGH